MSKSTSNQINFVGSLHLIGEKVGLVVVKRIQSVHH